MFARLFRSRWAALFWAAGVVWTAYDVAGAAPQPAVAKAAPADATGTPATSDDLAALAHASPD